MVKLYRHRKWMPNMFSSLNFSPLAHATYLNEMDDYWLEQPFNVNKTYSSSSDFASEIHSIPIL